MIMPRTAPTVVVIGGGFSGAAVVAHLAALATTPVRIRLFEASERVGRGVAYGVTGEHLLLNVPAGKLSVWPDRPGDFATWCASEGRRSDAGAFLPRAWLGEYAAATMASALEARQGIVDFERVPQRAEAVRRRADGGYVVVGESGATVEADHIVLANGNGPAKIPPAFRPFARDPRLIVNPWDEQRLAQAARDAQRLLLVGVGLTMMDVAVTLQRSGYAGEIVALSRRGLMPHPHAPSDPGPHAEWAAGLEGGDLMTLTRVITQRARAHPWRAVIDSLRPHTARLWRTLPHAQRDRFLARLAVHWDAHRHRCPQETASCIAALGERGAMRVQAATILSVVDRDGRFQIDARDRRTGATSREVVDAVILCTGPEPDAAAWRSPLFDTLLRAGDVARDPLGLGLCATPRGQAITASGAPNDRISLIGPLRKGEAWESTAVPEISRQAGEVAAGVLRTLGTETNLSELVKETVR